MKRDRRVGHIILIEGLANLVVLAIKLSVALSTGSLAVLADAIHSLSDLANNIIAWFIVRLSSAPADDSHPYGHRKFETLAVFALATLLMVMAFELVLHAIRRPPTTIQQQGWALALMLGVLAINIVVATWQGYWAKRLRSDILAADAKHTLADVLTTLIVIGGWQMSARGYAWLDTVCALGVAGLVAVLAIGLFRRTLPALVDESAIEPDELQAEVDAVPGVRAIRRVRSRWVGALPSIDMVITVDPGLSTQAAHDIADAIEDRLEARFEARDISIHIEPDD